jgi:hypothetical protein
MALLLGAIGCGPSLEQLELREQCLNNCSADEMTCLETSHCVDLDGHPVPCEEDCANQRATCDDSCEES